MMSPIDINLLDNQCMKLPSTFQCGEVPGYICVKNNTMICKLDSNGRLAWLRRVDGWVPFNRTWDEYVAGFGDVSGSFWLGLEKLHLITQAQNTTMYVELESWKEDIEWARYNYFYIAGRDTNYKLHLEGFSGVTRWDALKDYVGTPFSTLDKDHDEMEGNCAVEQGDGGGWWYRKCSNTFPTARLGGPLDNHQPYIYWFLAFGEYWPALKSITMKIQPTKPNKK